MNKQLNKIVYTIVDGFLIILGALLLILMIQQIWQIGHYVIFGNPENVEVIVGKVLAFFLVFEFLTMIIRYLQEGHHIPIRYLIYICITAILRHEIGNHTTSGDTLLVAFAILVLVLTLFIIKKSNYYGNEDSEKEYHI